MPDIVKVILLGIVEGITEWLPISSTGHLILLEDVLRLTASDEFMEMFRVVIQLGAILAVVLLYFRRLWPFMSGEEIRGGRQGTGSPRNGSARTASGLRVDRDKMILWGKILISCIPAILIGLPLDDFLDAHFYNGKTVACMLILYGVLFIVVENRNRGRRPLFRRAEDLGIREALLIGLFQVLALIPGTSRSGATILGGIAIGTSRRAASEYTFFLGIPVMFGASLLKIVKFGFHFTAPEVLYLLTGMLTAFLVSIAAIRFLLSYIRRHNFTVFGLYRIILGILVLILIK